MAFHFPERSGEQRGGEYKEETEHDAENEVHPVPWHGKGANATRDVHNEDDCSGDESDERDEDEETHSGVTCVGELDLDVETKHQGETDDQREHL